MASKRKSTVPCMIPAKSKHLRDEIVLGCLPELLPTIPEDSILSISGQEEEEEAQRTSSLSERGTHRCPPCSFQTTDLSLFLNHMDSCHVDFRTQTIFYCLSCKVSLAKFEGLASHNAKTHPELQAEGSPGRAALQVTMRDGVLTVEQMLFTEKENFSDAGISITKTPIMKMMVKGDHKKIVVSHTVEVQKADIIHEKSMTVTNGSSGRNVPTSQILTGTSSIPVPKMTNTGIQVTQNVKPLWNFASSPDLNSSLPKVMIPLSSIPTYDPAMDLSSFLKASFGKFPYPTKAELCYLTVVSGFPEEQIKLWFTAQRLKQGISWSPEEIEDTRRRMFNTVFQAAPKALQSQSHPQVPHHYVSGQPTSAGAGIIPHASKGSVIGRKGGVIVTQPGTAQGSSLKHQSVVQTSLVTVRHGIATKEAGNGLSSQKAESSSASQTNIASNHIHGEKNETGSSSSGISSAIWLTSTTQKKNSSCSEGSIINLTNIVRKIDCNVNNTNGTSKLNTSSAFIYRHDKATVDTKESSNSNFATSSKSNNGNIDESTSHSTICTKKEGNTSDNTSKTKTPDSIVICSSTGSGEFLLVQTGSLVDAVLSKNKSKLPEQLEALKQSINHSLFPERKLIATRDESVWEVDKPFHSHSLVDSKLALGHFVGNVPQTSLCSNYACIQEDNQFSSQSLPAQPEKLSPKSSLGAPQVPSADFTAVLYSDQDLSALEDHPQPSKAILDRSHFNSKIKQGETDAMFLEHQKSQANNTLYNTDKDEQCRIVHLQYTLKKDEVKKIAAIEEKPSLQQYTEVVEDQWEGNSSYHEPKTESITINSKKLNEAEHMAKASRKHMNNQHLDKDGGSCYDNGPSKKQESHQHTPANEHFVEGNKYIKKKSQRQNDQANCKELNIEQVKSEYLRPEQQRILHSLDTQAPVLAEENPEGIKQPSEKAPAKDHWLMKDEECQQDNQSRDCVRGELLKV
ncbi:zinc fingers and homeoboxes protein 1 [Colossoma macropomum]|uniref:zinc fingers and homeoboxes protein 1 n=1 Tax=Colossoma macropomum TaxID=42526 RepID=UPI0018647865|nr:zinc fingers and homeoboxes protein 1 [Colossoma macropomum]XP_036415979.1 zinc fingers and homeoboxes protein 1 [Colossoma macropomum]